MKRTKQTTWFRYEAVKQVIDKKEPVANVAKRLVVLTT